MGGDTGHGGACEGAACARECPSGFLDCDGETENGCEAVDLGEPQAARPLRPMLGHYTGALAGAEVTGALRPRFTWRSVKPGDCEVRAQIQIDDSCSIESFKACKFASAEVDELVTENEFTPSEDLPVSNNVPVGSRYYWRIRACDAVERCSDWSEVRYLEVGRDRQDVTGDGYPDVVLVDLVTNKHSIFPGGADFGVDADGLTQAVTSSFSYDELASTSSHQEDNPPMVRFVGDVDGDGFNDFVGVGNNYVLQEPAAEGAPDVEVISSWKRYLYLGAAELDEIRSREFIVGNWAPGALEHGQAAWDFNADGYADILATQSLVFVPQSSPDSQFPEVVSRVNLFLGGAPLDTQSRPVGAVRPPLGDDGDYLGTTAESGDFNGDGLPDLVFSAPGESVVHVVMGGAKVDLGVDVSVPYGESNDTSPYPCRDVRISVGNINGDDFDDFVINCDEKNLLHAYLGASTLSTKMAWTYQFESSYYELIDTLLVDLNRDGYDELISGNNHVSSAGVLVFAGSEDGYGDEPTKLSVQDSNGYFGAGDHNGDGFNDLLMGAQVVAGWIPGNGTLDPAQDEAGAYRFVPLQVGAEDSPVETIGR